MLGFIERDDLLSLNIFTSDILAPMSCRELSKNNSVSAFETVLEV
ncbi:hypothetical protein BBROOKSOX_349 [Bathymodiolus brooksi thiotrophic gill symbiont]|nr:hypothetical protein BBROOKSOX_349 [Bathymodiolus brooksi thiotrophic gill symbiont]